MTTKQAKEIDYQAQMRNKSPNPQHRRSLEEREQRRKEAIKKKITIRIDEDVIEEFKRITSEGRGYQSLINQALREWLAAQGVKELLHQELGKMVEQAFSSIQLSVKATGVQGVS